MKKIFFIVLFLLFIVVLGIYLLLTNQTILNQTLKSAINKSGLDIEYNSLKGSILGGLKIDGFNYHDDIKCDLKVDVDFKKLNDGILYIKDLEVKNLHINNEFIKELQNKDSKTSKTDSSQNSFLKKVIVENAILELKEFEYEKYRVDSLNLLVKKLNYELDSDKLKADIKLKAKTNVASLKSDIKIDKRYEAILDATIKKEFLKTFLKDQPIMLKSSPKVSLFASSDLKVVDSEITLKDLDLSFDDIDITSKDIVINANYDLKSRELKSEDRINLKTSLGTIYTLSDISLNIDDINNSLNYRSSITLDELKSYKDINLKEFGKVDIEADGSLKKLKAYIKSKLLTLKVDSEDFDRFKYELASKDIKLSKIYPKLPKQMQSSELSLKSFGEYVVSLKKADITSKIDSFSIDDKVISTDEFRVLLNDKDIELKDLILKSKDFQLSLEAKKSGDKVFLSMDNRAFKTKANLNLTPLKVDAKADIVSIDKLIKEINKVYPLDVGVEVDGAVKLSLKGDEKDIAFLLSSNSVKLKEGRFDKIDINGYYNKDRVLVKRFDIDLKGFKPKELNKKIRLEKDAVITLSKDRNFIDVAFKDLFSYKATRVGDEIDGILKSKALKLYHKEYGKTTVKTDLKIHQKANKIAVSGDIIFSDTLITYYSKYLDISKDKDIVIVKNDKKIFQENDTFLKDISLDLKVKSKDNMEYKVNNVELTFKPNLEIKKRFKESQKLYGKIDIVDGIYDLADKRFYLKKGSIAFRGQKIPNPLLHINVEYPIDDVVIKIAILGDQNHPRLKFKSKPTMSKKDIISYLLFGMSASESEGALANASSAAEKIFSRAISKDLARELNLDRLDLSRNKSGGIDIKAGKKKDKKTIIYYQNRDSESSVIVERKLSKKWSVESEVGKDGESLDFVYRKSYK